MYFNLIWNTGKEGEYSPDTKISESNSTDCYAI